MIREQQTAIPGPLDDTGEGKERYRPDAIFWKNSEPTYADPNATQEIHHVTPDAKITQEQIEKDRQYREKVKAFFLLNRDVIAEASDRLLEKWQAGSLTTENLQKTFEKQVRMYNEIIQLMQEGTDASFLKQYSAERLTTLPEKAIVRLHNELLTLVQTDHRATELVPLASRIAVLQESIFNLHEAAQKIGIPLGESPENPLREAA